jgi:hypothetical protein
MGKIKAILNVEDGHASEMPTTVPAMTIDNNSWETSVQSGFSIWLLSKSYPNTLDVLVTARF